MTIRHAPRVGGEFENERPLPYNLPLDEVLLLDPLPNLTLSAAVPQVPNPSAPTTTGLPAPTRAKRISTKSAAKEVAPVHPFQTDFGPQTLTQFLREQVDKLNRERDITKAKRKEKQKETAAPPALGLLDGASLPHGEEDLTSGAVPRRSPRLSRKSPSVSTILNPLAAPFLLAPSEPRLPSATLTQSTRATKFEEYTKNKRNAVRNNAAESPTSPLRASLRSSRLSTGPSVANYPAAESVVSPDDALASYETSDPNAQGPFGRHFRNAGLVIQKKTGGQPPQRHISQPAPSDAPQSDGSEGGDMYSWTPVDEPRSISENVFEYANIVPEVIPQIEKRRFFTRAARAKRIQAAASEAESSGSSRRSRAGALIDSQIDGVASLAAGEDAVATDVKQYPRAWTPSHCPMTSAIPEPSRARSSNDPDIPMTEAAAIWSVDENLWMEIARFLSSQDVKNLRLTGSSLAQTLAPIQLRTVVVNFDSTFFSNSMLEHYGKSINKFGIAFEYDLAGLCAAKPKVIESEQDAWFGKFTWPTQNYPRFPALQAIEDLVDNNRPLLKEALAHVTNVSELGLCIDSGHGWLEGPDISDMALFDKRTSAGSRVFGKYFETEDVWITYARNELFRWGQQNTINAAIKANLATALPSESRAKEFRFLDAVQIRDIESFRHATSQFDYDANFHTGGDEARAAVAAAGGNQNAPAGFPVIPNAGQGLNNVLRSRRLLDQAQTAVNRLPQWPLIFNGYNLAADFGGHLPAVQSKLANPIASPLLPGMLTEAQAQWLMETVWAQRAFLVSYTTAIITNKANFSSVRTLRISKLSSGLLPSLELQEFWKALAGLEKLEIHISPDWHQEYVTGDKAFAQHMPVPPAKAAERFTDFLSNYVAKLENLQSLCVGYAGGGEHAVGIRARNNHVLPAPIVLDPKLWLGELDSKQAAAPVKFEHVRELKFQNCWFSAWMLKSFMANSRDTSLHSLTLDSVSMVTIADETIEKPLTTNGDWLVPRYSPQEWPREVLPSGAAWVKALDAITPGKPLVEYKYEFGLINTEETPMPSRRFRGHIKQINLSSCGYVKISLPAGRTVAYNQNSAVAHPDCVMDRGLVSRKFRLGSRPESAEPLRAGVPQRGEANSHHSRVMIHSDMSWLGKLTQCIHPVEKRILEQAWGMKFGWGDDLRRWGAVEDGKLEGGAGRFSGVIR